MMELVSTVFFCLGAADYLLGNRFGLGNGFRQGFAAVVDLMLLMTGFMALAPWLGFSLRIGPAPLTAAAGLGAPGVIALLLFRALCLL